MKVPLVVLCPDGGVPRPQPVRDVSPIGAWIGTVERWYPGTILSVRLSYDPHYIEVARVAGNPEASVNMRARIRRLDTDGAGVEFVYLNKEERRRFERFLAGAQVRGKK